MPDWRDNLKLDVEQDEATGCLKSEGQWITTEDGLTEYGRRYFEAQLKMLKEAIVAALEEITFVETFLQPDVDESPEERAITIALHEGAKRDYAALLDYKGFAEGYLARRASAEEFLS